MAVTIGNSNVAEGNSTSYTFSHDHNGDQMSLAITAEASTALTTVSHGSDNFTVVANTVRTNADGKTTHIYELEKATQGAATVTVTFASKTRAGIACVSWQSAGRITNGTGTTGNAAVSSLTPASQASGDMLVDALASSGSSLAVTASGQVALATAWGLGGPADGGASYNPSTGSGTAISWSFNSDNFAHAAARVPQGSGDQTLTATLFTDTPDSFGSHTVTAGPVTLTATLYADTPDSFGSHTVSAEYDLTATLFSNTPDTFGSHTVIPGAVTLTGTLFADSDAYGAHTVTAGPVTLTAALYTDADSFGTHTVQAEYDLTAALFADTPDTFHSHTVVPGAVTLTATLFADTPDSFGAHTIVQDGGDQNLTATLFTDSDAFGAHSVDTEYTLTATPYTDPDSFGAHTVLAEYGLTGTLFSDGDGFYNPTVTPGAVSLVASLYAEPDGFGSHTITQPAGGDQTLTASLFTDSDLFGTHVFDQGDLPVEAATMRIWAVRGGVTVNGDVVLRAQQAAISSVTDDTGGTASDTLDDTTVSVRDDIASIAAKLNLIIAALEAHGLIAS